MYGFYMRFVVPFTLMDVWNGGMVDEFQFLSNNEMNKAERNGNFFFVKTQQID